MILYHNLSSGPYGSGPKSYWNCAGVVTYTDFSEVGISDCELMIGVNVYES